jgi:hypothetical protein
MRFRSPCRDDSSFVIVSVGINHRNFNAVHKANGINPNFAIVEAVVSRQVPSRQDLKTKMASNQSSAFSTDN